MLTLRKRLSTDRRAAVRLYDTAVSRSRDPKLYTNMGAPDTVEGRFELLTVHIILTIERLKGQGAVSEATRQSLFDLYVRNLDGALREMGVGDLAVSRRVKGLGRVFYGRAQAYEAAFAASDRVELEDVIRRTIFVDRDGADAAPLADYLLGERRRLAGREVAAMLETGA